MGFGKGGFGNGGFGSSSTPIVDSNSNVSVEFINTAVLTTNNLLVGIEMSNKKINPEHLRRVILDENGDRTGNKNAKNDYSSVDGVFYAQPIGDEYGIDVYSMGISLKYTSPFTSSGYGGGSALSTSIKIEFVGDSGSLYEFTSPFEIKTNDDWKRHVMLPNDIDGNSMMGEGSFVFKFGSPIRLDKSKGHRIVVTISGEDMSTRVSEQYFYINGILFIE
jgi:hypothetical protein